MDDKFRVVLEDRLLPLQVFFNAIPDRSFIETLKAFEKGIGAGFNDAFCGFPGEEDFDEEPLNGIEFAIRGEEIVVSYEDFLSILKDVCGVYLTKYSEQEKEVRSLLEGVEKKLISFE